MDEAGTWHGGRPQLRRLCVRWGPSLPPQKGAEPPPQFSAHFYCGRMAGCIKMPLGTDVGLSTGDFVLDGDPVHPPQKGVGASPLPKKIGPCLLRPNGWMDQDGTWHGDGRWSRPHCAGWGHSSLPKEWQQSPPPIFSPFLLCRNGWMHQNATWYGSRPQPRRLCIRWGPSTPSPKRGGAPNFWPSYVAKRLHGSRRHFVRR